MGKRISLVFKASTKWDIVGWKGKGELILILEERHELYTYIVLFNFISTCHHMGTLTKNVGVIDSQNSFGCFEVKQWCVMCIGHFIKPTHMSLCLTKLKQ